MITRTPKTGDEPLEFMKKEGWTSDQEEAYMVSEEDAKVFARQLSAAADQNGNYAYDYTTVTD